MTRVLQSRLRPPRRNHRKPTEVPITLDASRGPDGKGKTDELTKGAKVFLRCSRGRQGKPVGPVGGRRRSRLDVIPGPHARAGHADAARGPSLAKRERASPNIPC